MQAVRLAAGEGPARLARDALPPNLVLCEADRPRANQLLLEHPAALAEGSPCSRRLSEFGLVEEELGRPLGVPLGSHFEGFTE